MTAASVAGTVAITDEGWYRFLSIRLTLRELNFWTPSARRTFRAVEFSPFFFKLRAPHNAICGFAYFAQYSRLPLWLAWESFGQGNGCASQSEMEDRIFRLREGIRYTENEHSNQIGCIQLVSPTFFPDEAWIPQPADWHPRTQSSMRYDLTFGEGKRIWESCLATADTLTYPAREDVPAPASGSSARYGEPREMRPRLGHATFRIAVMEAYRRACAATDEHSLPALEAVHIRPYADDGPHEVRNGLLLRADLHRLFDKGYVTVTPAFRLDIGSRLKQDFRNGRSYYPLHGTHLRVPPDVKLRPAQEFLRWHNDSRFKG